MMNTMPEDTRTELQKTLINDDTLAMLHGHFDYASKLKGKTSVTDEDSFTFVANAARNIASNVKELEESRKEIGKPHKTKVDSVNKFFKEFRDPMNATLATMKKNMEIYQAATDAAIDKAVSQAEAEVRAKRSNLIEKAQVEQAKAIRYYSEGRDEMAMKAEGRAEALMEQAAMLVAEVKAVSTAPGGVSFRKGWDCQVDDMHAFLTAILSDQKLKGLIKHISVDTDAIAKMRDTVGELLDIPGLRFIKTTKSIVSKKAK
jgi:hypothetical protein